MNRALQHLARVPVYCATGLLWLYKLVISPVLHALGGPGMGCRHEPTCSCYAQQSLRRHGFWRGLVLAAWRLLRCHPWGRGGFDPVPAKGRWRDAFRRTSRQSRSSDCPLHG